MSVPKGSEQDHHDDGKNANTDVFSFLEAFHQAVQECGDPKKPFEQRGQHASADDGGIDNLLMVRWALQCVTLFLRLTSLAGQGSEMSCTPF